MKLLIRTGLALALGFGALAAAPRAALATPPCSPQKAPDPPETLACANQTITASYGCNSSPGAEDSVSHVCLDTNGSCKRDEGDTSYTVTESTVDCVIFGPNDTTISASGCHLVEWADNGPCT